MKLILIVINSISLILVLVSNFLFNTGRFFPTVGEVSKKYDTLFAPAGYAFSIWGIIYLLLLGFVVFQWINQKSKLTKEVIIKTGFWFFTANIINALWVFSWVNGYIGYCLILILLLLFCLIMIAIVHRAEIDDAPLRIVFFVWWPFTIYLGWIIVATVANAAAYFTYIKWKGGPFSEVAWTVIMILTGTIIYAVLIWKRNMREAAFVGIWAFIAIAIRQWHHYPAIAITALMASAILFIYSAIQAFRNTNTLPHKKWQRGEW